MSKFVIDFRDAKNREHLAGMLGTEEEVLTRIIDCPERTQPGARLRQRNREIMLFGGDPQPLFIEHSIPKRDRRRGRRRVWEIGDEYVATVYKTLLHRFHDFASANIPGYPSPIAHGYVPKRSILSNASVHVGAPLLATADIREFFPSITFSRIEALLHDFGLHASVARDLAAMVTIDGRLALGLPPSPMIANLICTSLDRRLSEMAARVGALVTRYADDLSFSGAVVPSRMQIASVLELEGFLLAEGKYRVKKRGQATFVTGLSVSDHIRARVPKRFKHDLRQALYYCKKFGIADHVEGSDKYGSLQKGVNKIDGSIRFLRGVERDLGLALQSEWRSILVRDRVTVRYTTRVDRLRQKVWLFVDETEFETAAGGKQLALISVVVYDVDDVREKLRFFLDGLLADPFGGGRKAVLRKKGLHFTDLSPEQRSMAYMAFRMLQCNAAIVVDALKGSYPETYERALQTLLQRQFMGLDRRPVEVIYEANTAAGEAPKRAAANAYTSLVAVDDRRPLRTPTVVPGNKTEPGLWIADGLLWAFQRFVTAPELDENVRRFERLRGRYRIIRDLAGEREFSRRRPLVPGDV